MDNFVDLFMVSPLLLVVLFFVAMLAGFIDALAGGGGLLTVPALLAAGMSSTCSRIFCARSCRFWSSASGFISC